MSVSSRDALASIFTPAGKADNYLVDVRIPLTARWVAAKFGVDFDTTSNSRRGKKTDQFVLPEESVSLRPPGLRIQSQSQLELGNVVHYI